MKTLQSLTKKEVVYKILRDARFLKKDKDLSRYARHELKDYIKYCCEHHHFIEAYSLVIQYAEDIIVYAVKRKGRLKSADAPRVMAVLRDVEIVSDEFHRHFDRINKTRNKLSHEVLRNPEARKKISNIKSHTADLIKLIDLAEQFFLDWVKKHPRQFVFIEKPEELSKDSKIKRDLLIDIIGNKTLDTMTVPKGRTSKKEFEERFKKEFNSKFNEVFGIKT